MSLSKHVDPEELIEQAADHPILGLLDHPAGKRAHAYHRGAHAGRYNTEPIPKYQIPQKGLDAEATYQVSTCYMPSFRFVPCSALRAS